MFRAVAPVIPARVQSVPLAIQKRSSRSSTSPRIIAEARYFSMPSTDPADNGHGDPFPDRPPQYVRALLYEYRFADPGTYVRTGQWWVRQLEGALFPAGQPGRLPSSRAARNWAASRDRRKSLTLTARRQLRRRFAGVRRGMLNASLPGCRPPCPSSPPTRSSRRRDPRPAGLGGTAPGPGSGWRRPSTSRDRSLGRPTVLSCGRALGTNRVDGSASSREFNRLGLLLTGRERLCGTGQVYPSPEGSPLAALGRSPRYGFGRTFFNPISRT